jgi:hypothetical protein
LYITPTTIDIIQILPFILGHSTGKTISSSRKIMFSTFTIPVPVLIGFSRRSAIRRHRLRRSAAGRRGGVGGGVCVVGISGGVIIVVFVRVFFGFIISAAISVLYLILFCGSGGGCGGMCMWMRWTVGFLSIAEMTSGTPGKIHFITLLAEPISYCIFFIFTYHCMA